MNREEIIRMAREADFDEWYIKQLIVYLERFAALVAKHEREACAKVADRMTQHTYLGSVGKAIRARGQA